MGGAGGDGDGVSGVDGGGGADGDGVGANNAGWPGGAGAGGSAPADVGGTDSVHLLGDRKYSVGGDGGDLDLEGDDSILDPDVLTYESIFGETVVETTTPEACEVLEDAITAKTSSAVSFQVSRKRNLEPSSSPVLPDQKKAAIKTTDDPTMFPKIPVS